MDIRNIISSVVYSNKQRELNQVKYKSQPKLYGLKMSKPLHSDKVSFSARVPKLPPKERMAVYAVRLLEEVGLKPDYPIRIEAQSKYIPFLSVITEEAYKKGSGKVSLKVIEPELEALKAKYGINTVLDYQREAEQELKDQGALFIKFDDGNCPYKASGLNADEVTKQMKSIVTIIPQEIQRLFELNPEEIFRSAMDIHEGEPVFISGEREHLPQIVKLADWLYGQNKSTWVGAALTELREFNPKVIFLKHAKDNLIGTFQPSDVHAEQEFLERGVASLFLKGQDPELYEGIDSKRILLHSRPFREAVQEYSDKQTSENPWLIYYAPTTKSVRYAYPEESDPLRALQVAYKDAGKINRVGKLRQHIEAIEQRVLRMNQLLDDGYRTIHYVSIDSVTKLPDGNTDLRIGLSEKSFFSSARLNMKTGHSPIVNIPTEEVFTSPTNNSANGWVSSTMPLVLNGKVIEGIRLKLKAGKIVDIQATSNLEMLQEHIKLNKGANRLGEVALVANSPIMALNRLFFETLLDENATCHIALGSAYPDVIKGALDIEDYAAQQKYLKKLNINTSTVHNDFMIGGPNVYVYAENDAGGQIPVIIEDKFVL